MEERERTQWRWSLRGVAIHLKQLLSLTPAIASQRGVAGGVRLERGVNGVVTELLMLRWIQVSERERDPKAPISDTGFPALGRGVEWGG